jgi:hypothetical protein
MIINVKAVCKGKIDESMELQIESIGQLSLGILRTFSDASKIGKVIHVFRDTVYLKTRNDHLICITSYNIRAPMYLNFKPDIDCVTLDGCKDAYAIKTKLGLSLKDIIFNIDSANLYCQKEESRIIKGSHQRALVAARTLSIFDLSKSLLDSQSRFFKRISCLLKEIAKSTYGHDLTELQKYLPYTIGLGNGFTPSMDDFLVGFLFCLNRLLICTKNPSKQFRIIGNTHWASKKFIEYAQMGYVIEPLENFVDSVFSGDEKTVVYTLTELIKIGHSSGIDASIGALFAIMFDRTEREYCKSLYNILNL